MSRELITKTEPPALPTMPAVVQTTVNSRNAAKYTLEGHINSYDIRYPSQNKDYSVSNTSIHTSPAKVNKQRAANLRGPPLEKRYLYGRLPFFIKPLPTTIGVEEVRYLESKSALLIPSLLLQNALLQAYVEYVHPYMPLEMHPLLDAIDAADGMAGQVSLINVPGRHVCCHGFRRYEGSAGCWLCDS
ncbi:hypothetical protein IL306_004293 [Fusarium sp. DS 682]|nr:hypothetical protein IL306_004293 [Fusarium sp. DS 682]